MATKYAILGSSLRDLLELRRINPELLARFLVERRVERGIKWLLENAPFGWRRNLFAPLPGGRSRRRFRDSGGESCVLALAFESRKDLINYEGHVTYARVTQKLGISPLRACALGFNRDLFASRPTHITDDLLDDVWEEKLSDSRWHNLPIRHLPPKEGARRQEILSHDFSLPSKPESRWWNRFKKFWA